MNLSTETSDVSKVGIYSLRIYARVDGDPTHYSNLAWLDFDMELIDPCEGVTFTIDASILSSLNIEYRIAQGVHQEKLQSSLVTPSSA